MKEFKLLVTLLFMTMTVYCQEITPKLLKIFPYSNVEEFNFDDINHNCLLPKQIFLFNNKILMVNENRYNFFLYDINSNLVAHLKNINIEIKNFIKSNITYELKSIQLKGNFLYVLFSNYVFIFNINKDELFAKFPISNFDIVIPTVDGIKLYNWKLLVEYNFKGEKIAVTKLIRKNSLNFNQSAIVYEDTIYNQDFFTSINELSLGIKRSYNIPQLKDCILIAMNNGYKYFSCNNQDEINTIHTLDNKNIYKKIIIDKKILSSKIINFQTGDENHPDPPCASDLPNFRVVLLDEHLYLLIQTKEGIKLYKLKFSS